MSAGAGLPGSDVLAAERVVTSSAVHAPGWVRIEGDTITAVGAGRPEGVDAGRVRDLGAAVLVPGFVDLHVHGGGGAGYPDGTADAARTARAAHLAHGTTATMASLVTAAPADLLAAVRTLAPLVAAGELRGLHLEGPWLSPARAGAHDPALLRDPAPAEIDALLEAGAGAIRMVTIAPELPGALDAIERLVTAGVIVAVGHTDADYDTTVRAIDAGATVATHLFNAMPPLHHRAPGPVLALCADPRVTVELVADGVHLHPALVDWTVRAVGADRAVLVTDAMGAACCGDGAYRLGPLDVEVSGGVARLAGSGTIAGSTTTMDALFRAHALRDAVPSGPAWTDDSLREAVRLTAVTPARVGGWSDIGDIAPGRRADLVVLDEGLRVREVLLGGVAV